MRLLTVIILAGLLFISTQAFADKMPHHHAGFFAILSKDFFSDIEKSRDGFEAHEQMVLDLASKALEEERLSSWSTRPVKIKNAAKTIAKSIGLNPEREADREILLRILEQNDPDKRAAMLKNFKPNGDSETAIEAFQDAYEAMLEKLESKNRHVFNKQAGLQSLWDKPSGAYRSVIGKAGAEQVLENDIILYGQTKIGLDEKYPNDLEITVEPATEEPVLVLTEDKIKEVQKQVFGNWWHGKRRWIIEEAEADTSLITGDKYVDVDPIGLMAAAQNARPIKITVIREDGTEYTMRNAYMDGLRIWADHKMDADDKQDIRDLPEWVIDEGLAKWFPGHWFALKIIPALEPEDLMIEADEWRLHVTYSNGGLFGKRISDFHDPYIENSFSITRKAEPEKIPVKMYFVDEAGVIYEEDLPYGESVRLMAVFDKVPEEDSRDVALSWNGEGITVEWVEVKREKKGGKVYFSTPFLLEDTSSSNTTDGEALGESLKL